MGPFGLLFFSNFFLAELLGRLPSGRDPEGDFNGPGDGAFFVGGVGRARRPGPGKGHPKRSAGQGTCRKEPERSEGDEREGPQ